MTRPRLLRASERWFRLLQRLYPPDFRDQMGDALVEAYLDRAAEALGRRGAAGVFALWLRALIDSLRNGVAERLRPAASWRRAGHWGRDIELVRRRIVHSPVFAATTIGTLTIGLGMFAVAYTAVDRVLIAPMPYQNADDLYYVWRDYGPLADVSRGALDGTDILELQNAGSVIEDAAGLQPFLGGIFSSGEGAETMEIAVTWATPNLFDLLGVIPVLGRAFAPDEIGRGRGQVMVLTRHLWNRLGADPAIVGTTVQLQGRPFTVIGVLPEDFRFVRSEAATRPQRVDAYIPIEVALTEESGLNDRRYAALIRARAGTSPDVVASAVDAIGRAIDARDFEGRGLKLYPVGMKADVITPIRPALLGLGVAGLVLLLMLLVNLASVLLTRAAQREHEVAVSRALGASGGAIVRSTLLEGGVLGLIGGALGAAVAIWGTRALLALAPLDLPRRDEIALDGGRFAIVVAIGGLLGLLAAAAPAVWAARTSLSTLLAPGAVRGGGGRARWRRGLIVAQVALSLVLLCSGALVARSLDHLLRADPGFQPEGVFTVRIRTPPEFFPQYSDAVMLQDRVIEALATIPGVTGASATAVLPLTAMASYGGNFQERIAIPGAPGNTGDPELDAVSVDLVAVRAHYVEVMGMRLVEGRTFIEPYRPDVFEVLIDAALARRFFPEGGAVGATIPGEGGNSATIIGVVEQARLYDLHADGRPQVLFRVEASGIRPLFYVVRTTRDPRALLPEIQAAVHRVDPRVPVGEPRAMPDIVRAIVSPQSIGTTLIGAFALGALLLAAMGLFAVVSGAVTRRRHELAIRLALGADQRRALRLVMREGTLLVAVGLLVAAPGVYVANRVVQGLLVGVSPFDPMTLSAAALGLLAVAMVTCYVPARRVLAIDPARLLRED